MIPKIVHYVWFGGKQYPKKIQYCIESWKKYLPEYQFIRWDESNFDVNSCLFTKQAYDNGQWAFISDYVRIQAIYEYGGWYLDTDVEVLKPLAPFEGNRLVFGTDEDGALTAVYGSEPHNIVWEHLLEIYNRTSFIQGDGTLNRKVINQYIQDEISTLGYVVANKKQCLGDDIVVYPDDFFHVVSLEKGTRHFTENSTCIHWQTMTWTSKQSRMMRYFRLHILKPLFGEEKFMIVWKTMANILKGN